MRPHTPIASRATAVVPRRDRNGKGRQQVARDPDMRDGERHLGLAGIGDGGAHLGAQGLGEQLEPREHETVDAVEQGRALGRGRARPAREGAPGGGDRPLDVGRAPHRDLGDHRLARRGKRRPRARRPPARAMRRRCRSGRGGRLRSGAGGDRSWETVLHEEASADRRREPGGSRDGSRRPDAEGVRPGIGPQGAVPALVLLRRPTSGTATRLGSPAPRCGGGSTGLRAGSARASVSRERVGARGWARRHVSG